MTSHLQILNMLSRTHSMFGSMRQSFGQQLELTPKLTASNDDKNDATVAFEVKKIEKEGQQNILVIYGFNKAGKIVTVSKMPMNGPGGSLSPKGGDRVKLSPSNNASNLSQIFKSRNAFGRVDLLNKSAQSRVQSTKPSSLLSLLFKPQPSSVESFKKTCQRQIVGEASEHNSKKLEKSGVAACKPFSVGIPSLKR